MQFYITENTFLTDGNSLIEEVGGRAVTNKEYPYRSSGLENAVRALNAIGQPYIFYQDYTASLITVVLSELSEQYDIKVINSIPGKDNNVLHAFLLEKKGN